jgi:hypothetical protein
MSIAETRLAACKRSGGARSGSKSSLRPESSACHACAVTRRSSAAMRTAT